MARLSKKLEIEFGGYSSIDGRRRLAMTAEAKQFKTCDDAVKLLVGGVLEVEGKYQSKASEKDAKGQKKLLDDDIPILFTGPCRQMTITEKGVIRISVGFGRDAEHDDHLEFAAGRKATVKITHLSSRQQKNGEADEPEETDEAGE